MPDAAAERPPTELLSAAASGAATGAARAAVSAEGDGSLYCSVAVAVTAARLKEGRRRGQIAARREEEKPKCVFQSCSTTNRQGSFVNPFVQHHHPWQHGREQQQVYSQQQQGYSQQQQGYLQQQQEEEYSQQQQEYSQQQQEYLQQQQKYSLHPQQACPQEAYLQQHDYFAQYAQQQEYPQQQQQLVEEEELVPEEEGNQEQLMLLAEEGSEEGLQAFESRRCLSSFSTFSSLPLFPSEGTRPPRVASCEQQQPPAERSVSFEQQQQQRGHFAFLNSAQQQLLLWGEQQQGDEERPNCNVDHVQPEEREEEEQQPQQQQQHDLFAAAENSSTCCSSKRFSFTSADGASFEEDLPFVALQQQQKQQANFQQQYQLQQHVRGLPPPQQQQQVFEKSREVEEDIEKEQQNHRAFAQKKPQQQHEQHRRVVVPPEQQQQRHRVSQQRRAHSSGVHGQQQVRVLTLPSGLQGTFASATPAEDLVPLTPASTVCTASSSPTANSVGQLQRSSCAVDQLRAAEAAAVPALPATSAAAALSPAAASSSVDYPVSCSSSNPSSHTSRNSSSSRSNSSSGSDWPSVFAAAPCEAGDRNSRSVGDFAAAAAAKAGRAVGETCRREQGVETRQAFAGTEAPAGGDRRSLLCRAASGKASFSLGEEQARDDCESQKTGPARGRQQQQHLLAQCSRHQQQEEPQEQQQGIFFPAHAAAFSGSIPQDTRRAPETDNNGSSTRVLSLCSSRLPLQASPQLYDGDRRWKGSLIHSSAVSEPPLLHLTEQQNLETKENRKHELYPEQQQQQVVVEQPVRQQQQQHDFRDLLSTQQQQQGGVQQRRRQQVGGLQQQVCGGLQLEGQYCSGKQAERQQHSVVLLSASPFGGYELPAGTSDDRRVCVDLEPAVQDRSSSSAAVVKASYAATGGPHCRAAPCGGVHSNAAAGPEPQCFTGSSLGEATSGCSRAADSAADFPSLPPASPSLHLFCIGGTSVSASSGAPSPRPVLSSGTSSSSCASSFRVLSSGSSFSAAAANSLSLGVSHPASHLSYAFSMQQQQQPQQQQLTYDSCTPAAAAAASLPLLPRSSLSTHSFLLPPASSSSVSPAAVSPVLPQQELQQQQHDNRQQQHIAVAAAHQQQLQCAAGAATPGSLSSPSSLQAPPAGTAATTPTLPSHAAAAAQGMMMPGVYALPYYSFGPPAWMPAAAPPPQPAAPTTSSGAIPVFPHASPQMSSFPPHAHPYAAAANILGGGPLGAAAASAAPGGLQQQTPRSLSNNFAAAVFSPMVPSFCSTAAQPAAVPLPSCTSSNSLAASPFMGTGLTPASSPSSMLGAAAVSPSPLIPTSLLSPLGGGGGTGPGELPSPPAAGPLSPGVAAAADSPAAAAAGGADAVPGRAAEEEAGLSLTISSPHLKHGTAAEGATGAVGSASSSRGGTGAAAPSARGRAAARRHAAALAAAVAAAGTGDMAGMTAAGDDSGGAVAAGSAAAAVKGGGGTDPPKKYSGIWFDPQQNCWRASWVCATSGKRKFRYFSAAKFGHETAMQLARETKERAMERKKVKGPQGGAAAGAAGETQGGEREAAGDAAAADARSAALGSSSLPSGEVFTGTRREAEMAQQQSSTADDGVATAAAAEALKDASGVAAKLAATDGGRQLPVRHYIGEDLRSSVFAAVGLGEGGGRWGGNAGSHQRTGAAAARGFASQAGEDTMLLPPRPSELIPPRSGGSLILSRQLNDPAAAAALAEYDAAQAAAVAAAAAAGVTRGLGSLAVGEGDAPAAGGSSSAAGDAQQQQGLLLSGQLSPAAEQRGLALDPVALAERAKEMVKVPGVYYDSARMIWRAFWHEGGRRVIRYFTVNKHGFRRAHQLALLTRRQAALAMQQRRRQATVGMVLAANSNSGGSAAAAGGPSAAGATSAAEDSALEAQTAAAAGDARRRDSGTSDAARGGSPSSPTGDATAADLMLQHQLAAGGSPLMVQQQQQMAEGGGATLQERVLYSRGVGGLVPGSREEQQQQQHQMQQHQMQQHQMQQHQMQMQQQMHQQLLQQRHFLQQAQMQLTSGHLVVGGGGSDPRADPLSGGQYEQFQQTFDIEQQQLQLFPMLVVQSGNPAFAGAAAGGINEGAAGSMTMMYAPGTGRMLAAAGGGDTQQLSTATADLQQLAAAEATAYSDSNYIGAGTATGSDPGAVAQMAQAAEGAAQGEAVVTSGRHSSSSRAGGGGGTGGHEGTGGRVDYSERVAQLPQEDAVEWYEALKAWVVTRPNIIETAGTASTGRGGTAGGRAKGGGSVRFRTADGRDIFKIFTIRKYGFRVARERAIEWRNRRREKLRTERDHHLRRNAAAELRQQASTAAAADSEDPRQQKQQKQEMQQQREMQRQQEMQLQEGMQQQQEMQQQQGMQEQHEMQEQHQMQEQQETQQQQQQQMPQQGQEVERHQQQQELQQRQGQEYEEQQQRQERSRREGTAATAETTSVSEAQCTTGCTASTTAATEGEQQRSASSPSFSASTCSSNPSSPPSVAPHHLRRGSGGSSPPELASGREPAAANGGKQQQQARGEGAESGKGQDSSTNSSSARTKKEDAATDATTAATAALSDSLQQQQRREQAAPDINEGESSCSSSHLTQKGDCLSTFSELGQALTRDAAAEGRTCCSSALCLESGLAAGVASDSSSRCTLDGDAGVVAGGRGCAAGAVNAAELRRPSSPAAASAATTLSRAEGPLGVFNMIPERAVPDSTNTAAGHFVPAPQASYIIQPDSCTELPYYYGGGTLSHATQPLTSLPDAALSALPPPKSGAAAASAVSSGSRRQSLADFQTSHPVAPVELGGSPILSSFPTVANPAMAGSRAVPPVPNLGPVLDTSAGPAFVSLFSPSSSRSNSNSSTTTARGTAVAASPSTASDAAALGSTSTVSASRAGEAGAELMEQNEGDCRSSSRCGEGRRSHCGGAFPDALSCTAERVQPQPQLQVEQEEKEEEALQQRREASSCAADAAAPTFAAETFSVDTAKERCKRGGGAGDSSADACGSIEGNRVDRAPGDTVESRACTPSPEPKRKNSRSLLLPASSTDGGPCVAPISPLAAASPQPQDAATGYSHSRDCGAAGGEGNTPSARAPGCLPALPPTLIPLQTPEAAAAAAHAAAAAAACGGMGVEDGSGAEAVGVMRNAICHILKNLQEICIPSLLCQYSFESNSFNYLAARLDDWTRSLHAHQQLCSGAMLPPKQLLERHEQQRRRDSGATREATGPSKEEDLESTGVAVVSSTRNSSSSGGEDTEEAERSKSWTLTKRKSENSVTAERELEKTDAKQTFSKPPEQQLEADAERLLLAPYLKLFAQCIRKNRLPNELEVEVQVLLLNALVHLSTLGGLTLQPPAFTENCSVSAVRLTDSDAAANITAVSAASESVDVYQQTGIPSPIFVHNSSTVGAAPLSPHRVSPATGGVAASPVRSPVLPFAAIAAPDFDAHMPSFAASSVVESNVFPYVTASVEVSPSAASESCTLLAASEVCTPLHLGSSPCSGGDAAVVSPPLPLSGYVTSADSRCCLLSTFPFPSPSSSAQSGHGASAPAGEAHTDSASEHPNSVAAESAADSSSRWITADDRGQQAQLVQERDFRAQEMGNQALSREEALGGGSWGSGVTAVIDTDQALVGEGDSVRGTVLAVQTSGEGMKNAGDHAADSCEKKRSRNASGGKGMTPAVLEDTVIQNNAESVAKGAASADAASVTDGGNVVLGAHD